MELMILVNIGLSNYWSKNNKIYTVDFKPCFKSLYDSQVFVHRKYSIQYASSSKRRWQMDKITKFLVIFEKFYYLIYSAQHAKVTKTMNMNLTSISSCWRLSRKMHNSNFATNWTNKSYAELKWIKTNKLWLMHSDLRIYYFN